MLPGLSPKQITKLQSYSQTARAVRWTCAFGKCTASSVRSHLVQKRGALLQIAENGHVVELREDNLFSRTHRHYFRSFGINEAMTFSGFCALHDHDIFREIENEIDVDPSRFALLQSYRALVAEARKKQANIEWCKLVNRDTKLIHSLPSSWVEHFRSLDSSEKKVLPLIRLELDRLEAAILRLRPANLIYETVALRDTGLCVSSVAAMAFSLTEKRALQMMYFHLLPQRETSNATLVWLASRVPLAGFGLDPYASVSDLLLRWTETWAIRPSTFDRSYRPRSSKIIQEFSRLLIDKSAPSTIDMLDYAKP